MNLFDLVAKITIDKKGYESGVADAKGALDGFGQKASGVASKLKSGLGMGAFMAIGTKAVNAVTSSFSGFIGGMDSMNSAWKNFESNMSLNHTKEEIATAKADMQDFASKSQFYSSKMAATYAQLDAVGTKATGDVVKGLGGIAASTAQPQEAMDSLSRQMTQVMTKPMVQWSDFQVMMEQAPAGMAEVASQMGMSLSELTQAIQGGSVSSEQFAQAITAIGGDPNNELMKAATTYKSIGDAMSGVTGYLQSQLAPAFDAFSQVAIGKITGLFNVISSIDKEGLANWTEKLLNAESVGEAIQMISDAITNGMPVILEKVVSGIETVLTGIADVAPAVVDMLAGIVTNLITYLGQNLPMFMSKGLDIIIALANGIVNNLPQLLDAGLKALQGFIQGIITNLPQLLVAAVKLIVKLGGFIVQSIPKLLVFLLKVVISIPKYIIQNAGKMASAGLKLVKELWNGFKDWFGTLLEKVGKKIEKIPEKVGEFIDAMIQAGKDLLQGLWDGIKAKWKKFKEWWNSHVGGIGKNTRKQLEEHSPSKLFKRIGRDLVMGFAIGIEDNWYRVDEAMQGLNDIAKDGIDDFGDMEMGFTSGTFDETISLAMSDVVNNVLGQIVPYMQESITDAMDGIQITMDKRAFGKATRKAVANAL